MEVAASELAASAGAVVTIVIAAITTAVIEGINVANATALPGKLAALIANPTAPDPASLLNDANGTASLFSLFVGATLPEPLNQTCDNSPFQGTVGYQVITATSGSGCLNPTAIPAPTSTDPTFLVQAKGRTTRTTASTITLADAALQITSTARLSGNWFIVQANGSSAPVQTLRLAYTDWSGNRQVAWLRGNPTSGYQFVGFNVTAGTSTALDPTSCGAAGLCWSSPSIDYVGSDGTDYSASVQGYKPPTGSPFYSTPVEGSPATFNANGYAPGAATPPITYRWEFQQSVCNLGCLQFGGEPGYTAPIASNGTTDYTFPTSGNFQVRLTAIDATGKQAVDTFTVNVGEVPPTLALNPDCPADRCVARTAQVGTALSLAGTITHAGAQDVENVSVNWGDGSSVEYGYCGIANPIGRMCGAGTAIPGSINIGANATPPPLTLTADASNTHVTLSDAHTYAKAGTYVGTVSVSDQSGRTASQTFVETITNPAPTLSLLAPPNLPVGSSPPLAIHGSGFVPGSTVQWNGTLLTTTYISPTELTAQVPATATTSAAAVAVTVVNAAPGGGTSSPQILYITPAHSNILAARLATSTDASGKATASLATGRGGSLSATASGTGSVALAVYGDDPLTTAPPAAGHTYFNLFVPASSSFNSVEVTVCNLDGSVVDYYDGTTQQWAPIAGQTHNTSTGCGTFTLDAGSTPSPTQSGGIILGVQNAPPTLSDPGAQSVQYGGQVHLLVSATGVEATDRLTLRASGLPAGLFFQDNHNGTGTVSGAVTAAVGSYTATVSANDGYSDAPPVTVAFTVTPAPLTITALNKSMTYGGSVPAFTASYSGLANGDPATVVSGLRCGATDDNGQPVSSTPPGTYAIVCSGGSATNYALSYREGTLTITPAPLTITADNQSMVAGGSLPALTESYSGFVNGETAAALSTVPTCTTTATSSSPPGQYAITCSGAIDPNYTLSYQGGTLTITAAPTPPAAAAAMATPPASATPTATGGLDHLSVN